MIDHSIKPGPESSPQQQDEVAGGRSFPPQWTNQWAVYCNLTRLTLALLAWASSNIIPVKPEALILMESMGINAFAQSVPNCSLEKPGRTHTTDTAASRRLVRGSSWLHRCTPLLLGGGGRMPVVLRDPGTPGEFRDQALAAGNTARADVEHIQVLVDVDVAAGVPLAHLDMWGGARLGKLRGEHGGRVMAWWACKWRYQEALQGGICIETRIHLAHQVIHRGGQQLRLSTPKGSTSGLIYRY